MRPSLVVLFLLALASLYSAQGTDQGACPTCNELTGRPQAELISLVDSGTRTLEVHAYYEDQTTGGRVALPYAALMVQVTPTSSTSLPWLYLIYTDGDGTARYDFNSLYCSSGGSCSDIEDMKTACLDFKAVYCPFCVPETGGCGFAECLSYSNIDTLCSSYSNGCNGGRISGTIDTPVDIMPSGTVPGTPNSDRYLPQISTAGYCPPPVPGSSTPAICLPLIIVFSLLSGALYVTGRNPFVGFNLGGARIGRHIRYQARGRGVSVAAMAVGGGVLGKVAGKALGKVVGKMVEKGKGKGKDAGKEAPKGAKAEGQGTGTGPKGLMGHVKQAVKNSWQEVKHNVFLVGALTSTAGGRAAFRAGRADAAVAGAKAAAEAKAAGKTPAEVTAAGRAASLKAFTQTYEARTSGQAGGSGTQTTMGAGGKLVTTAAGGLPARLSELAKPVFTKMGIVGEILNRFALVAKVGLVIIVGMTPLGSLLDGILKYTPGIKELTKKKGADWGRGLMELLFVRHEQRAINDSEAAGRLKDPTILGYKVLDSTPNKDGSTTYSCKTADEKKVTITTDKNGRLSGMSYAVTGPDGKVSTVELAINVKGGKVEFGRASVTDSDGKKTEVVVLGAKAKLADLPAGTVKDGTIILRQSKDGTIAASTLVISPEGKILAEIKIGKEGMYAPLATLATAALAPAMQACVIGSNAGEFQKTYAKDYAVRDTMVTSAYNETRAASTEAAEKALDELKKNSATAKLLDTMRTATAAQELAILLGRAQPGTDPEELQKQVKALLGGMDPATAVKAIAIAYANAPKTAEIVAVLVPELVRSIVPLDLGAKAQADVSHALKVLIEKTPDLSHMGNSDITKELTRVFNEMYKEGGKPPQAFVAFIAAGDSKSNAFFDLLRQGASAGASFGDAGFDKTLFNTASRGFSDKDTQVQVNAVVEKLSEHYTSAQLSTMKPEELKKAVVKYGLPESFATDNLLTQIKVSAATGTLGTPEFKLIVLDRSGVPETSPRVTLVNTLTLVGQKYSGRLAALEKEDSPTRGQELRKMLTDEGMSPATIGRIDPTTFNRLCDNVQQLPSDAFINSTATASGLPPAPKNALVDALYKIGQTHTPQQLADLQNDLQKMKPEERQQRVRDMLTDAKMDPNLVKYNISPTTLDRLADNVQQLTSPAALINPVAAASGLPATNMKEAFAKAYDAVVPRYMSREEFTTAQQDAQQRGEKPPAPSYEAFLTTYEQKTKALAKMSYDDFAKAFEDNKFPAQAVPRSAFDAMKEAAKQPLNAPAIAQASGLPPASEREIVGGAVQNVVYSHSSNQISSMDEQAFKGAVKEELSRSYEKAGMSREDASRVAEAEAVRLDPRTFVIVKDGANAFTANLRLQGASEQMVSTIGDIPIARVNSLQGTAALIPGPGDSAAEIKAANLALIQNTSWADFKKATGVETPATAAPAARPMESIMEYKLWQNMEHTLGNVQESLTGVYRTGTADFVAADQQMGRLSVLTGALIDQRGGDFAHDKGQVSDRTFMAISSSTNSILNNRALQDPAVRSVDPQPWVSEEDKWRKDVAARVASGDADGAIKTLKERENLYAYGGLTVAAQGCEEAVKVIKAQQSGAMVSPAAGPLPMDSITAASKVTETLSQAGNSSTVGNHLAAAYGPDGKERERAEQSTRSQVGAYVNEGAYEKAYELAAARYRYYSGISDASDARPYADVMALIHEAPKAEKAELQALVNERLSKAPDPAMSATALSKQATDELNNYYMLKEEAILKVLETYPPPAAPRRAPEGPPAAPETPPSKPEKPGIAEAGQVTMAAPEAPERPEERRPRRKAEEEFKLAAAAKPPPREPTIISGEDYAKLQAEKRKKKREGGEEGIA